MEYSEKLSLTNEAQILLLMPLFHLILVILSNFSVQGILSWMDVKDALSSTGGQWGTDQTRVEAPKSVFKGHKESTLT